MPIKRLSAKPVDNVFVRYFKDRQNYGIKKDIFERFLHWIHERHTIHLRRKAGEKAPWTDDPVLQNNFFTNPYRENDKTTIWFRDNFRDQYANSLSVVFGTIAFRWFNYIPTGEILLGKDSKVYANNTAKALGWGSMKNLLLDWDGDECERRLSNAGKFITGAYIIKVYNAMPKLQGIRLCLDTVWLDRHRLLEDIHPSRRAYKSASVSQRSMEWVSKRLTRYLFLGGFMAYEISCDLRYTDVLRNAADINTWCNPGPGAARGMTRIMGIPLKDKKVPAPRNFLKLCNDLLYLTNQCLHSSMSKFEMREIEHSLCEFDKYERCRTGEGKSKRNFNGR